MLHGHRQLKRFVQFLCISLLAMTLPACDQARSWLGVTGSDNEFKDYGIYRVMTILYLKPKPSVCAKGKYRRVACTEYTFTVYSGTGFLINDKNIVATAAHVVRYDVPRFLKDKELSELLEKADIVGTQTFVAPIVDDKGDPGKYKLDFVEVEIAKDFVDGDEQDLAFLRPKKPLPGKPFSIADYEPLIGSEARALGYPGIADEALQRDALKKIEDKYREPGNNRTKEGAQTFYLSQYKEALKQQYKENPAQFAPSYVQGVVSRAFTVDDLAIVQHQAPIAQGNSGGPLLDACGSVIGINVKGRRGINFALAGSWIMQQVKLAGQEAKPAKLCFVASTQKHVTWIILAIISLLSSVTVFLALRRTPSGQRGYTALTRVRAAPFAGGDDPRMAPPRAPASSATALSGGTVFARPSRSGRSGPPHPCHRRQFDHSARQPGFLRWQRNG